MADNKIQGRAKKFDGTAIDYVSIFNWIDGRCISQVIPDASGNWQYKYKKDLKVGVTYVANNCEPVTHGPYEFTYEYDALQDVMLHYRFNGNLLDESVNSLDGIKTGSTIFVAGRKDGTQAIEFINGCIRTPTPLPISGYQATISFWVDIANYNGDQIIIELSDTLANNDAFAINIEGGTLRASMYSYGGYAQQQSSPSTGTWHHIVIVMNRLAPADEQIKIYVDNVDRTEDVSGWINKQMLTPFSSYVIYIGQRAASLYPYTGKMQDLRIYDRMLTELERAQLFSE